MSRRSLSPLGRILVFVAAGSLAGALTVVAVVLGTAAPALAACTAHHTNVEGYDTAAIRYGNSASIYVNTSSTVSSSVDSIFRSLFVSNGSFDNDVEVGWTANNGGHSGPTVYSEWVNRGADSGPQFYTGYSLNYDTHYRFSVINVGHIDIFRFLVDGQSSPFNYSPTMNFNRGTVITNSEHHNTCDSMWTDMSGLEYFDSSGNYVSGYGNLACYYNGSINDWLFNKISNTELKVDQGTGSSC